jgi:TackOD1 domain-containing protein
VNASSSAKLRALPAIAAVTGDHARSQVSDGWYAARTFGDPQQLIGSGFSPEAILLAPNDPAQAASWLESLRRDARLGLKPLLLTRQLGATAAELSDGIAADGNAIIRLAMEMSQRVASVKPRDAMTADDRLLFFLLLRPERLLSPLTDWRNERICRYPLADAFCESGEDGLLLIDRLRRRGLLENTSLLERIHACSKCGSGHLLFIERCPQCGGIDIAEQTFLHCYACGHVGTQDDYLRNEGLSCPQCLARLRHIGVDYDRALETLSCQSCAGRFTEPDIKTRCLQCQTVAATDALVERRFHGLRLTAAGELAARTGQVGDLFRLMDEFSQAHPDYFIQTLDWLINVSRRHREVQFGLACLGFSNVHALAASLPGHRLAQMFDALAQRLRALIRTTDLFMREDDTHCWLLLPQTTASGMKVLLDRIAALSESSDGHRIEIAISSLSSAEASGPIGDARVVMGTLRNSAS